MLPTVTIARIDWTTSTYGMVLAAYFVMALLLTTVLATRRGIEPASTLGAFAVSVPFALMGARLLDVLEYWGSYRSFADLLGRQGSSIYGALFASFTVLLVYAKLVGVPVLRFLDAGAPAMALGEAMSRLGCFLNGCCYGTEHAGPLAVTFPRTSFAYADQVRRGLLSPDAATTLSVHPVQLYSAGLALLFTAILLKLDGRSPRDGGAFYRFLVFYGALRLTMATVRAEALPSMFMFSAAFVLAGMWGLARARRPVALRERLA